MRVEENRVKTLRGRVCRDCRILILLDPGWQDEFMKKLEMRCWEVRLKDAGEDLEKLLKLYSVLVARLGHLSKKLRAHERDNGQGHLPLE